MTSHFLLLLEQSGPISRDWHLDDDEICISDTTLTKMLQTAFTALQLYRSAGEVILKIHLM